MTWTRRPSPFHVKTLIAQPSPVRVRFISIALGWLAQIVRSPGSKSSRWFPRSGNVVRLKQNATIRVM